MANNTDTTPTAPQTVWVDELLANHPFSVFAFAILLLCIAAGMTEGYDTQVMALAAPMVARAWALTPQQTGLLLSGSVFGVVVGSFLLAPLGDRLGRRPSILLGLGCAGIATVCGGLAQSLQPLLISRFVAGLALGLAFPNVIALAMEFMPLRARALAVVLVNCGYPLGSGVGGVIAARMIPIHGVQVIFFVGGIATLSITSIALFALPESPLFLARNRSTYMRLRSLLARLGAHQESASAEYAVHDATEARSPAMAIFEHDRRLATILLWIISLSNMAMVYYMFTWLPSIIAAKGATPQLTILSISAFSMGSVFGGIVMALSLRRFGPTAVLATGYALTIATTLALCTFSHLDGGFLITLALVGSCTGGSQFCLSAVINQFYPSTMRTTAAGYATGVGRIGAILAPAAGVIIMSSPTLRGMAFAAPAVPACIALAALFLLQAKTPYAQDVQAAR